MIKGVWSLIHVLDGWGGSLCTAGRASGWSPHERNHECTIKVVWSFIHILNGCEGSLCVVDNSHSFSSPDTAILMVRRICDGPGLLSMRSTSLFEFKSILSLEAALLLVSTKNRDLWPGLIFWAFTEWWEVSRTSTAGPFQVAIFGANKMECDLWGREC